MNAEECNPGATLVDITTFISVQNLLDNPTDSHDFQILDLCSLLDALVLSNRIVILEPPQSVKQVLPSPYPDVLRELSSKCGNIEVLHWSENGKLDDIILALADEILSNEREKRFLEQHGKDLDITGYFKTIIPSVLGKTTLESLESKGFSIASGILLGLGHEYRAREYLRCSAEKAMPYYPHCIREPMMRLLLNRAARMVLLARKYVARLEIAERERREYLNSLKGVAIFDLDFPAIPTYIVSRCKNPGEIIDEAIELIRGRDTREFRDFMEQFERAIFMGGRGRKEFEKYERTVEDYMGSLEMNKRGPGYELHSVASVGIEDILKPETSLLVKNVLPVLGKLADFAYKRIRRRQLTFLGALAKNVSEITSSRDMFEKLFRKRLDARALGRLREQASSARAPRKLSRN